MALYKEIHEEPVEIKQPVIYKVESCHDNDDFFNGYEDRLAHIQAIAHQMKEDVGDIESEYSQKNS